MSLSQQELETWLWGAANILRGPVDPANLREFIFPLMFLKRLSDTWGEEHAKAVKVFGEDVHEEVAADFHSFDIPDGCHWSDLRRVTENHGFELQRIMQSIEAANPDKLAQIFGNAPWANPERMPPDRLERLIDHFGQKYLGHSAVSNDLLGRGYEYLLKKFSDESATSAGQHFTPREVVHLLVRILDPKPTDTVYDPACGSGGMLIEAANEVIAAGGSVAQMRFYGQEINQTSASIGRVNLLIHSIEDATVLRGDTLRNPKFVDHTGKLERFDVVVANPPFSLEQWGSDAWATDPHRRAIGGVPPDKRGDFAWVQHMIASMANGTGRVGVVMPHGVLFRGRVEVKIRQHLIERDLLEAVIGLAPNLFYGTTIPACLLIFRAAKPKERVNHVLFVDGQTHYVKGSSQNELSETNVEDLHAAYRDPDTSTKTLARLVSVREIERNDWDLNIGRYLDSRVVEVVDMAEALTQLEEARRLLALAGAAMIERLNEAGYGLRDFAGTAHTARSMLLHDLLAPDRAVLGWRGTTLGEIAQVVSGGTPKTKVPEYWGGDIVWVIPSEVVAQEGGVITQSERMITQVGLASSSAKMLPKGAVLLTSRATIGAVALAGVPLCTNQGFASLVPSEAVLSHFLMYWCQANTHEFTLRSGGNTFKEVSRKKVARIPITLPSLSEQRQIVDLIKSVDSHIGALHACVDLASGLRTGLLSDLLSGRHEIPASYDRFLSDT